MNEMQDSNVKALRQLLVQVCDEWLAEDDEGAHIAEDQLHQQALKMIAEGAENPQELAATALRSLSMPFQRWCA